MTELEGVVKRTIEYPLAAVEADVMEIICLLSLIEYVGGDRCVPDVTDTERRIEVKTNYPLVVHIYGLIDEIESVRRLVWQLHC